MGSRFLLRWLVGVHGYSIHSPLHCLVRLKWNTGEDFRDRRCPWASWTPLLPPVPPSLAGVRPGSKVTLLPASQPSHPQFPDLQTGIRELKLNHHALVLSDNTGSLKSVFLSLGGISERSKYRKSMRSFLILPRNLYLFISLMGAFSHVFWSFFDYTGQSLPCKYFILLICLVIKKKLQLFSWLKCPLAWKDRETLVLGDWRVLFLNELVGQSWRFVWGF